MLISAIASPTQQAQAQPYQDCVDEAWNNLVDCSYDVWSDLGVNASKNTVTGGAVGGKKGGKNALKATIIKEVYDQGICTGHFTSHYSECQGKSDRYLDYDSDQYSEDFFSPSNPDYARDTTGDGLMDQSYPNVSDEDYYGYSESFGDTFNQYNDW